jgi:hypothetical protein
VQPTFVCKYKDYNGTPIQTALVNITFNGTVYPINYSVANQDYRIILGPLQGGTYPWYCSASADGYQPQKASTENYVVKALFDTTLTQSASPYTGTGYRGVQPTFVCKYKDYNGTPIQTALVNITFNGTVYPINYSFANQDYRIILGPLQGGTYPWYCSASADGYQPQKASTENYVVKALFDTTLTQSASPYTGTGYTGVTPTFVCSYKDYNGTPIQTALVNITFSGTVYPVSYSPATRDYRIVIGPLLGGTYPWYCSASADGYQPQIASVQNYVVISRPVAALKGGPDGYLYIPNASKIDPTGHTLVSYLKIDLWCNMSDTDCQTIGTPPVQICGCNRTWCDQTGGTNPYYTKANAPAFWRGAEWPDGKIRVDDTLVITTAFGSNEGDTSPPKDRNWSYIADCRITDSERKVRVDDALRTASGFGANGYYSKDLTNIRVKFNNNPNYFTPDANGYIQIPSGATSFTVYNGTKPVLTLATFYNSSLGLAAATTKPAGVMLTPTAQPPIGDTWTLAVVILTIIGLALGYFIIRETISASATRTKKRK